MVGIDKTAWAEGPWKREPDRAHWTDKATGLDCLILRGPRGALCGYVGVPVGHPWHGGSYDGMECDVHGGLTYAGYDNPKIGISVEGGAGLYWVGFDCSHAGDLAFMNRPGFFNSFSNPFDTYRNFCYVRGECIRLAAQAAEGKITLPDP